MYTIYLQIRNESRRKLDYQKLEVRILFAEKMKKLHSTDSFKESIKLLRDLADLQNGAPLEQHREEWEQTMEQVYAFLNKHES